MTPKERAAMQQALDALEDAYENGFLTGINGLKTIDVLTAMREARAEQAEQEPSCNQHPDAPHGFDRNASHNAHRYVCECEGWEPEQADGEKWSPDDMAYRPGGLSMEQAEQEPIFSSKCPKCSHKVISTHSADLWWCNKCLHEWPFNKQSEKQSVSQEVKELRQQVAALKAVLDAWNNVEQEPVAKVVLNRANQITMQKPNGDYFDISKHVGEYFYAAPVRTKDLTDAELNNLWIGSTKGGWLGLFRSVIAADREKNK